MTTFQPLTTSHSPESKLATIVVVSFVLLVVYSLFLRRVALADLARDQIDVVDHRVVTVVVGLVGSLNLIVIV